MKLGGWLTVRKISAGIRPDQQPQIGGDPIWCHRGGTSALQAAGKGTIVLHQAQQALARWRAL